MIIGDYLYFSPEFKFKDIDFDNRLHIITAFTARVEGFYLNAASYLIDQNQYFTAGLICIATIDLLAKMSLNSRGNARIVEWLEINIPVFRKKDDGGFYSTLAERFCKEYRNGLVHECRVKNGGQFAEQFDCTLKIINNVMIINPSYLVKDIHKSLIIYTDKLHKNDAIYHRFKRRLKNDYQKDVEFAKCN